MPQHRFGVGATPDQAADLDGFRLVPELQGLVDTLIGRLLVLQFTESSLQRLGVSFGGVCRVDAMSFPVLADRTTRAGAIAL